MYKSLLDMFKEIMPEYKADIDLYNRIKIYRLGWAQKSDEYISFLGGNLTGTEPIRFSEQDESMLYTDIFRVDKKTLQNAVNKTNGINPQFKTISNATYITLAYTAHLFTCSNLKKDIIEDACVEISHIFCYKCVASLVYHYFKYSVDVQIAKAVNERLNKKYLIRKYDSWQKVFDHRSKDFLPGGIHYKRLVKFSTDDSCRILMDYQTKIRELIKNIYVVLMEVINNNEKISSSSLLQRDSEGKVSIRDITNARVAYITYVKSIITSKVDFVNEDIIELMLTVFNSVSKEEFINLLDYISSSNPKELNKLDYIIETSILSCLSLLQEAGVTTDFHRNIYKVVTVIKNGTISISKRHEEIRKLRSDIQPMLRHIFKKNRSTFLINISAMLIVYIFLRAIYK